MTKVSKDARICIVGAGAAGLSTAYFLKKQGYRNVLVLEKAGRVGGLCCSITYNSRSFDLGANYLTPAYKEVLKMAEEVGAQLYSEGPGQVYNPFKSQPGQPAYTSIMNAVTEGTDPSNVFGSRWALLVGASLARANYFRSWVCRYQSTSRTHSTFFPVVSREKFVMSNNFI
ncbi:hypothetical protein NSTCB13_06982 [Nostoc sp. DSM 114160]|jgi:hypothetical protein